MGGVEDRVKRLHGIIKDQRPHAINEIYRVLDPDYWHSSREVHGRLTPETCQFNSTRRYLLDLRDLGMAEHRQTSCGTAQWRRRFYNGEKTDD